VNGRAGWAAAVRQVARAVFLASLLAVIVLSLLPQAEVPQLGISDKLEHFAAYAGLALLGGIGFPRGRWQVLLPVLLIALGIALEFLQHLAPGRASEVADALANGLGASAGGALAAIVRSGGRTYLNRP
jgi:VanZ family protein